MLKHFKPCRTLPVSLISNINLISLSSDETRADEPHVFITDDFSLHSYYSITKTDQSFVKTSSNIIFSPSEGISGTETWNPPELKNYEDSSVLKSVGGCLEKLIPDLDCTDGLNWWIHSAARSVIFNLSAPLSEFEKIPEGIERAPTQSSSLTPLTLHITSFSSARKDRKEGYW